MIPVLQTHRSETAKLCDRYGVRRLGVFGSASVEQQDSAARDIDLLVDLDRVSRQRPLPCYIEFKSDLESLLGKPVDLVELDAMARVAPAVTHCPFCRARLCSRANLTSASISH